MKNKKKTAVIIGIVAVALIAIVVLVVFCIPKSVATAVLLGDADSSGNVTIKDATIVQKYTAGIVELSDDQFRMGDVNADGNVNIRDATAIQRHCAGIVTEFSIGQTVVDTTATSVEGSQQNTEVTVTATASVGTTAEATVVTSDASDTEATVADPVEK